MADYFAQPKAKNMFTWTHAWSSFTPRGEKKPVEAGQANYVGVNPGNGKRFKLNRVVDIVKDDITGDEIIITKE